MGFIKSLTRAKARYYLKNKDIISIHNKTKYDENKEEMIKRSKNAYHNGKQKEMKRLKYLPTKLENEKYRLFRLMFST
jgi:lipocalin